MFRQPETGWTAPTPIASSFDQTVVLIQKHRKANPAITTKSRLATNPEAIAFELETFTRKRLGIPEGAPSPFPGSPSMSPSAGAVVAGAGDRHSAAWGIKRAAQGTAVPVDWLASGGNPVPQELAEKRAAVCAACPKNESPEWYSQAGGQVIEAGVKAWQALKGKTVTFETSQGDKLKSCGVCKCLLRVKVFVPLEHIVQHTKPEVLAEFPPECWIAKKDA